MDGIGLAAVLHEPSNAASWPAVVASHGLLSSKESDKYLRLAAALPARGMALCRFDFRGCGQSGGALGETTLSAWLRDLRAVIAWTRGHPRCDGRVALMGSSMGGFLSVWAASREPGIAAVVTWAAPAALHDLADRRDIVAEAGLGYPFLAELRGGHLLEAPDGVGNILIVHGDADETVPVEHGRRLWKRAADPKRLEVLAGADHRILDPVQRERAVTFTVDWLRQTFGIAA